MTAAQPRTMRALGYVDVVDFVERTTYEIWNDRRPELLDLTYPDDSVIWSDGGDVHGGATVRGTPRGSSPRSRRTSA